MKLFCFLLLSLLLTFAESKAAFECDPDRMWNVFRKSILFEDKGFKLRPEIGLFNQSVDEELDNYTSSKVLYLNKVFNIKVSQMKLEESNIFLFYTKDLDGFLTKNWNYIGQYFYDRDLLDVRKQAENTNYLNNYTFNNNNTIGSILLIKAPISRKLTLNIIDIYFMQFLGLRYVDDDDSILFFENLGYRFDLGFRSIDAFLIETFYSKNIFWLDPLLRENFYSFIRSSRWCLTPQEFFKQLR
jgi:hypothetical protein